MEQQPPNHPPTYPAVIPLTRDGRLIGTCTNYTPLAQMHRGYAAVELTPRWDAVLLVWRHTNDPQFTRAPLRVIAWRGAGAREVLPVPHYHLVAAEPGKDWYFTNNDVLDQAQRTAVFQQLVQELKAHP